MELISSFFADCGQKTDKVSLDSIYAMDEMAIRLDSYPSRTYEEIGARRVSAVSTGHELAKLPVALVISASGKKLPLLVIVPRKTVLKEFVPPANVVVMYKTNATFDSNMFLSVCNFIIDSLFKC